MNWLARFSGWRLQRRAHRWARKRTIHPGEWLVDLGMPTPLAVTLKKAYDIQQGRCICDRCEADRVYR